MKNSKLLYDTHDKPPLVQLIILAFQHVFAMFGATVLMPILVNQAAGEEVISISTALLASGIGTILYILCTKGKSPVYLGSSFAYITPVVLAFSKGGTSAFASGIISVGLIYIIFALIIKKCGKNWIDKLLPPVVVGPMIMIIGLSLAPNAIKQIGINSDTIVWQNIVVALVAFITTITVAIYSKGFLKVIPFLSGILAGYFAAVCLNLIVFDPITDAEVLSLPRVLVPFKDYSFSLVGVFTIAPLALVSIAEHIGDHMALSSIIGKDLIKDPGLDRTLLGDGIATFVAGALGGPANTTYGENTSVVGMTKVASVKVISMAALFAIVIGFLGKFTALVSTIPSAVLGGVSLLLYGFIAVNGLKVLIKNQVNFEEPKNIIVASSMLVLGLGGAAVSIVSGDLSLTISGMSLAALVGIILNVCLPKEQEEKKKTNKKKK